MRLWHQSLIPYLDRQRLLGAHRECCALRGKGWGKKHATVDYVFTYDPAYLVMYHFSVMDEMERRGFHPDSIWRNNSWRGAELGADLSFVGREELENAYMDWYIYGVIFPEHDNKYLVECIQLLQEKGADCDWQGITDNLMSKMPNVHCVEKGVKF